MPASAIVESGPTIDTTAVSLVPVFDGRTGPAWSSELVRLQLGLAPSYAVCKIPLKSVDTVAPAIAAVAGSPLESIRLGSPGYVIAAGNGGDGSVLLAGVVTDIDAQFAAETDQATVTIEDRRYLLAGTPIIGSWWASGEGEAAGLYSYRQGWHLHLNPNGQPNCIFRATTDNGLVPMMCTPSHGLGLDEQPPLDSAASVTQACYWTSRTVVQYLRWYLSDEAYGAAIAYFPFYQYMPSGITWPEGLHSALANEDDNADRKGEEHDYDGESVLAALDRVVTGAGPYALYAHSSAEDTNSLSIISTRYAGGGITVSRPTAGDAVTSLAGPLVVLGGNVRMSATNLYSRFVVNGDMVFIERRVSTTAANDGALREGWDAAAQTAFVAHIQASLDAGIELAEAKNRAHREYPAVCHYYHLDQELDMQTSTSESGMPHAKVGRPILPTLLTSYLESTGSNPEDRRRYRRPILFEYQAQDDDPTGHPWSLAEHNDGLAIDADGTLRVPGLREAGYTYDLTVTGSAAPYTVSIKPTKLRATLAIPCDHRLFAAYKTANDLSFCDLLLTDEPDQERIHADFARTYYASTKQLYGKDLRDSSYPVPVAAGGVEYPDLDGGSAEDALRDDTALAQQHAWRRGRDLSRLERSGTLMLRDLMAPLRPGQELRSLANSNGEYALGVVVTAIVLTNRAQDGLGGSQPGQYLLAEVM